MSVVGLRDVFVVAPASSFHHHHHHGHPQESALFQSHQEHQIIPLLAEKSSFWQQQQQQNSSPNPNPNPFSHQHQHQQLKTTATAGMLSATSSSGGTTTCQDCGNQAKKDCTHRRCRTCCKSRGFDCSTHVKSTWVPAARRRERQLSSSAGGPPPAAGSSASTSAPKKPRLAQPTAANSHTSTSNNTATRSFDTSSSHQDASFRESLPGQVTAPALFKCVRVTAVEDDGEDEFAYQAMVRINGHVFKGFLYDQGTDDDTVATNNNTSSNAILNISELHLGGAGGRNGPGPGPSSTSMVPADMAGLLGGTTNYGNPIN